MATAAQRKNAARMLIRNDYRLQNPAKRPAQLRGAVFRVPAAMREQNPLGRPADHPLGRAVHLRSEEHTSELQSLMRISYAVFCLNKKNERIKKHKKSEERWITPNRRTQGQ